MEKLQHIRAFITAVNDYLKHQNEKTASALQMNLGVSILCCIFLVVYKGK